MGPSNYRYNPFSDTADYVDFVERRIIPRNSPFEISLREVPFKADPSDVSIKELDISNADIAYGQTFVEVATTPSQGQFWMDYNTDADGDENWNTGRIQFSPSDAGKIVEIFYTGTGTLATVTGNSDPYWFYDYGDGSDGHMVITEETVLLKNTVNCKSLIIKAGAQILPAVRVVPLIIKSQGLVIIDGTINADYYGAMYSSSVSNGGGAGGTASNNTSTIAGGSACFLGQRIDTTNNVAIDYMARTGLAGCGAGGGAFFKTTSYGGGAVRIAAPEIIINGTILARGLNGAVSNDTNYNRGGGGGGTVCIACNHILNNANINVKGGVAGNSVNTAGGDGWYRIFELS